MTLGVGAPVELGVCRQLCGREPADGVGAQWRGTRCGEKENKKKLSVAQWCTKSFAGPLSGDRGSCMRVLIPHRGGVLECVCDSDQALRGPPNEQRKQKGKVAQW